MGVTRHAGQALASPHRALLEAEGGKARAKSLSASARKKIASDAAKKRWKGHRPHNGDTGYIAEKIFKPTDSHVVIYKAVEQQIDVDGHTYAVVCSKHSTIHGDNSLPSARGMMKYPEFCEDCMTAVRHLEK